MRQPEAAGNSDPLENFRSRPGQQVYPAPAEIRLSPAGSGSTPSRADGQPVPRGLPADTLNWRNSAPAPAPAPSHPRPPETLHSPAPLAPMRLAPPRPAVEAAAAGTTASTQAATFGRVLSRSAEVFRPRPQSRGPSSLQATTPPPRRPPPPAPAPPPGGGARPPARPPAWLPVRMHALACPHSLALAPSPSPPPPPALTPALAVSVGAAHARRRQQQTGPRPAPRARARGRGRPAAALEARAPKPPPRVSGLRPARREVEAARPGGASLALPPGARPRGAPPPVAGLTGGTRPFARCPAPGPRRRVPHDHAVRDGGEAAPHPSAPPAPNHERRSSPGPPADGRAAGYREPTEAPAALRYRYV
ncbi:basic proline-rich protein-like [Melospiza georgiana]|uniref:basic proline-rich protein-like n=1 Tax=Melospiza georgiana TaxID=44398 RepID=UPI0025AD3740|nr:basic proline-rich protein-like [Melospiza georgiana]